jgi:hypothetical protein
VLLGRVKHLSKDWNQAITLAQLQQEGFDSVFIPRRGGDEYVIFNPAQAVPIKTI